MKQHNAAKLTHLNVQEIRALGRNGFTARSIAEPYGITGREVSNILRGCNWQWLPVEDVPLPLLERAGAEALVLRNTKRQTAEQRRRLDAYRQRLAAHIDWQAEREGQALKLAWKIRRPKRQREVKRLKDITQ